MGPNFTRGGFQDPRFNRGGPGNPGTINNMPRFSGGYRPSSPFFGSGQRPDLGRYVPPMMEGNNWRDRGGYAYNLPNSFGPSPDFGEFNSPYAPMRRPRWDRNFAGGDPDFNFGGGDGSREELRRRLAEMLSGGGMTAGPYSPKPPSQDGYKGPDEVSPAPQFTERRLPGFRTQEEFDAFRWGNRRPSWWDYEEP